MQQSRVLPGVVLLIVAALIGVGILTLPPRIIESLETVRGWGTGWFWAYVALLIVGGVLIVGAVSLLLVRLWGASRKKKEKQILGQKQFSEMSSKELEDAIRQNLTDIQEMQTRNDVDQEVRKTLDPLLRELKQKQQSQELEIVAFGTVSSGKSSILNLLAGQELFETDPRGGTTVSRNEVRWPAHDRVVLVDTPGLAEVNGADHVLIAADSAKNADLVLSVIDGPLRDHEFQLLKRLSQMEKSLIVCLNKADWYSLDDQKKLKGQVAAQLQSENIQADLILVRSSPVERIQIVRGADGVERERAIQVEADISELAGVLLKRIKGDARSLLLSNLLLRSRGLVEQARSEVKASLERSAWQIVDKYMWGAGSVAALSPFPVFDLIAGCAISAKMVVDIAKVYRQDVDLDIAMNLLGQLAKNLVSILGLSLATPTIATVASQMFKAVPGIGTLAGGFLQGVVQALVTRWIGAVFIAYFSEDLKKAEGGLSGIARREWDKLTQPQELMRLVQRARAELKSGTKREGDE